MVVISQPLEMCKNHDLLVQLVKLSGTTKAALYPFSTGKVWVMLSHSVPKSKMNIYILVQDYLNTRIKYWRSK